VDDFFVAGASPGVEASVLLKDTDPPQLTAQARDRSRQPEVAVVARPVVSEQYDTAVNVTSLAVFAQCPRRYYIGRYIGWQQNAVRAGRKFDPEDLPAAELGSLVHEVLAGKPGPHPPEALELAAVFQNSDLGRRAAAAARSEREWDFIADIDGTLIRGTIDLWFEEPDGIHIVDYKTDSSIRTSEHAPQLALYAVALERAFGKRPVRASLHYLRSDVVEDVPLHDAAIGSARDLIAALRDAQETLAFEPRDGPHCLSCPHRSLCPAGIASDGAPAHLVG
jgi:CRISPR/Cas system-associated exonuclease Cas4 (RecB family)